MTAQNQTSPNTMRVFFLMWIGQVVSVIGSGLTSFSLVVWTYQQSESILQTALVILAQQIPAILVAPFAGLVVDRWDRRWTMMLSDTAAGLTTLAIAILLLMGMFEPWHVYVASSIYSLTRVFQEPAYISATSILIPKEHYGRVSGLTQLADGIANIAAPAIAGALLFLIDLRGILIIDFITFMFALLMLLAVRIPEVEKPSTNEESGESFWYEVRYGWTYIVSHSGLLHLLILFSSVNFIAGFVNVLLAPLVLSFTTATVGGMIMSVAGIGALCGAIVMSIWGGPKRRIYGVIGAMALLGVLLVQMGLRPDPVLVAIGAFGVLFTVSIMQGCNQAIWQSQVPLHIQGRVFATQKMILLMAMPVSTLLAGPLADQVFEPLMAANGALATSIIGQIIGIGQGRGVGLMYIIMGFAIIMIAAVGAANSHVRHVESDLPGTVDAAPAT
jgi:MFS transporter, DHA3 family, macrolide efflux protein